MDNQSSDQSFSRRRIVKIILVVLAILIIIVLGIVFIPGFFGGKKTSTETSEKNNVSQTTNTEYPVEQASLLNLDKVIKSPHFAVYFHSANQKEAESLINICENEYSSLAKFFPSMPMTEILITFDADEYINSFNAAPPWGAESYNDPQTSAGAFCPGCTKSLGQNTEYIYMLRSQNKSFAHELAHRYYWTNYPKLSRDDSLTWLNEGQAVYVQNEIAPGPGGLSSDVAKINNISLPANFTELNLLQQKGDGTSLERFYDLVGLMAYYIAEKSEGGIGSFLTDLNNSNNLDKTCQTKLGFGADELFADWQETIKKTAEQNPANFLASFKQNI